MLFNKDIKANFPSDDIDPSKKDREWLIQVAKAMYCYGMNDQFGFFNNNDKWRMLREYALGEQSLLPVMNKVDPFIEFEYKKVNEVNKEEYIVFSDIAPDGKQHRAMVCEWRNIQILPRIMDNFVGKFLDRDYAVSVDAIDEFATKEKTRKKHKIWAKKQAKDLWKQLSQAQGVPFKEDENEPESVEELELRSDLGANKLTAESAMEGCINFSLHQSIKKELEERKIRDLGILNKCCSKTVVNKTTGFTEEEYIRPELLIHQYSTNRDCRDIQFAGHVKEMTIADFRILNPNLTETKVRELASRFDGKYGNGNLNNLDPETEFYKGFGVNYDILKIYVLCFDYISTDGLYDSSYSGIEIKPHLVKERELKSGHIVKKDDKYYRDFKETKTLKESYPNLYEGVWVIDSDYIFNDGLVEFQTKEDKINTRVRYNILCLPGKSLVEACKPYIDDLQVNDANYQNAIANASNQGYVYPREALVATASQVPGMNPLNLIALRRKGTGDLIINQNIGSTFDNLGRNQFPPLQKLEGGVGSYLVELDNDFDKLIQKIQFTMGFSANDVGQPNEKGTPVTETNNMVQNTQITLKSVKSYFYQNYEWVALKHGYLIQKLVSHLEFHRKAYTSVVGEEKVEAIMDMEKSKLSITKWGCKAWFKLHDAEKTAILDRMKGLMEGGRNGNIQMTPDMEMALMRALDGFGGIKTAEILMTKYVKKMKDDAEKKEKIMMQQNAQTQQQAKQQDAQIEKEADERKLEAIKEKGNQDRQTLQLKIELEHKTGMVENMADHAQDLQKTNMENQQQQSNQPPAQ